jgi:hypothetical protein
VFATLFVLVAGVPCAYQWHSARPFNQDILMWMLSTRCFGGGCAVPDDVPDEERSGRLTPTLGHRCLVPDQPPIVVWMLFTYFKDIPDIIEAGQMDGWNTWGEIKEILIPLCISGSPTALLTFIFAGTRPTGRSGLRQSTRQPCQNSSKATAPRKVCSSVAYQRLNRGSWTQSSLAGSVETIGPRLDLGAVKNGLWESITQ